MSKEQLEELKEWKINLEETLVSNGHEIGEELTEKTRKYKGLLGYAIEQIQELEEANKSNYWIASDFKFENLVLEEQIKRYREAIKNVIEMISVSTGTITKPKEISLYDAWEIKNTLFEALEGEE